MTQDLTLKVLEKTDLDFLHRLYNDPDVMYFWFREPFLSKATVEENFEKSRENKNHKSFVLKDDDDLVGIIQLFDVDFVHRKAEFAIMIDPLMQGKGYALPATNLAIDYSFTTLNLNKLYLIADVDNEKAIHIYEKAGFTQEAILKQEYFVNGEYHDITYMSCFQEDYLKQKRVQSN